jgi:hypothetical protein
VAGSAVARDSRFVKGTPSMNARPRRRLAAVVLGLAPLVLAAELAAAAVPARSAVALNNPVQCVLENVQCAKDAASGNNPCDPLPC